MFFVLLSTIVPLVNAIIDEQENLGSSGASRLILYGVVAVLFLTIVIIVMLFIRLKTKITDDGIYLAYIPFVRKWKKIAKDDITGYELRKFQAVLEYGGYGMRMRRKAGKAYTISGNTGLQLYLKDGKKLLIGTQKKQALKYAMQKLMPNANITVNKKLAVAEKKPFLGRKTKKVLIIMAIEIFIAIIVLAIIQLSK